MLQMGILVIKVHANMEFAFLFKIHHANMTTIVLLDNIASKTHHNVCQFSLQEVHVHQVLFKIGRPLNAGMEPFVLTINAFYNTQFLLDRTHILYSLITMTCKMP